MNIYLLRARNLEDHESWQKVLRLAYGQTTISYSSWQRTSDNFMIFREATGVADNDWSENFDEIERVLRDSGRSHRKLGMEKLTIKGFYEYLYDFKAYSKNFGPPKVKKMRRRLPTSGTPACWNLQDRKSGPGKIIPGWSIRILSRAVLVMAARSLTTTRGQPTPKILLIWLELSSQ